MSQLIRLARQFNSFYFNKSYKNCVPFMIDGHHVGFLRQKVVEAAQEHPDSFVIDLSKAVTLHPRHSTIKDRSDVMHEILSQWRTKDLFLSLRGWRNECFDVKASSGEPPLMEVERSGTCLLGVIQYGIHINGYVRHPEAGKCLWMQQRSSTKPTWPGKWDSLVGGGIPSRVSAFDTVLAEAKEEASIPSDLLAKLQPAGSVSFFYENERGVFPSVEYVCDLELPPTFVPHNTDGEVDSFQLVPVAEVTERIVSSAYKETSAPVALDFLIRHGCISARNEPFLADIMELLHFPLHLVYDRALLINTH